MCLYFLEADPCGTRNAHREAVCAFTMGANTAIKLCS